MSRPPVTIVFLGGLGEIGRNCFCLEVDGRILVVDCGIMFPDVDMPGVDLVLPDFTYLRENADRVEGVFLTHAHEDHAGGLAFLLRDVAVPIYGSPLSLGLARNRIEEAGMLERTELIPVHDGERRWIGPFDCEFIPVTHSVPHAFATAYHTPAGTILHSGDFKLDLTPVDGRKTDLALIGEIAKRTGGVKLLLSDSTNAERPGFTPSETTVGTTMRAMFRDYPDRRFIVASFASHLHRVQQVCEAAVNADRRVAFLGRSMTQNVALAREMGLLDVPTERVIDIEEVPRYAPGEVCVVCTGSQGEPLSALVAHGRARAQVHQGERGRRRRDLRAHDPGERVERLARDRLAVPRGRRSDPRRERGRPRLGPCIAGRAEVPARHRAARLVRARARRVPPPRPPRAARSGSRRRSRPRARVRGRRRAHDLRPRRRQGNDGTGDVDVERRAVPAGYQYVDGIVGDVGLGVLRDRRNLAEEGLVVVIVTVDAATGELVTGPEIVTRGWVYAPEAEELLEEAKAAVRASLAEAADEGATDFETIRRHARRSLGKFINERTRRRPAIIPVVIEV